MENKEDKKTTQIVEEAARIFKDNPHLKYYEAIEQAKKIYEHSVTK